MNLFVFLILFLLIGCANISYKSADCDRFRYKKFNILACDDESVNIHCHKDGGTWDDGTPVDSRRIRGCYKYGIFNRKGLIFIGRSYLGCLPHEICHAEGYEDKFCMDKYPCVGEGK